MSKDKSHRAVATNVLFTANSVVTTERGGQHGGAEDSFQMIGDLWALYLNNANRMDLDSSSPKVYITPKDVAQMMVLLKIARNVHGQLKADDFVDQAGYTGLAAALAGLQPDAPGLKDSRPPKTEPVKTTAPYTSPASLPVTKSTVVVQEQKPEQPEGKADEDDGTIRQVIRNLDKDITA